jgi:small-conductance mechanosensitive channel/CRP-like cAMP-binding protein
MEPTPLQSILGLGLIGPNARVFVEVALASAAVLLALMLSKHARAVWLSSLVMCALGLALDAIGSPQFLRSMQWWYLTAAIALVLTSWGLIKLLLDAVDATAHRRHANFSTIFKDLLMIVLYAAIVMAILRIHFRVDPTPLFASTAVIAVIIGLALQEVLGNIFSGVTLQVGKRFVPGDWVRSGAHLGRVQGIGWRSTAVITRANEKLEIPNSTLAKEILINCSNGDVADEISIGLSYAAAPNYVRQVIQETLRDVPGVLPSPTAEILAWEYADFAIRYRIRYWIADYADVERIRDAVNTRLWYTLRRKSIEIPFPIRTFRMQAEAPVIKAPGAFEREITQELRRIDFLRDLPDDELQVLLPGVTVQHFGAGETIVRQGDQGDSLYLIRSGTVEVVAAAREGQQVHIRDLVSPAFFGEMALMTGDPRSATVRARTDAELLQVTRDGFVELFKTHPEAAAQMGEVIALRMSETRELLAAAPLADDARNRARRLLDKMRSVFNLSALR